MKENLVNQINMFLSILPVVLKKHNDSSNSPILQFFRREYETAYMIQNTVRNQLQDLKNYCESGVGYTNEIQVVKDNILKGIFRIVHLKVQSQNIGEISLRTPSHLR